jgi:hypothetical protein
MGFHQQGRQLTRHALLSTITRWIEVTVCLFIYVIFFFCKIMGMGYFFSSSDDLDVVILKFPKLLINIYVIQLFLSLCHAPSLNSTKTHHFTSITRREFDWFRLRDELRGGYRSPWHSCSNPNSAYRGGSYVFLHLTQSSPFIYRRWF